MLLAIAGSTQAMAAPLSREEVLKPVRDGNPALYAEMVSLLAHEPALADELASREVPFRMTEAESKDLVYYAADFCRFDAKETIAKFPAICRLSRFLGITGAPGLPEVATLSGDDEVDITLKTGRGPEDTALFTWTVSLPQTTGQKDPARVVLRRIKERSFLEATYYAKPEATEDEVTKTVCLLELLTTSTGSVKTKESKVSYTKEVHDPDPENASIDWETETK